MIVFHGLQDAFTDDSGLDDGMNRDSLLPGLFFDSRQLFAGGLVRIEPGRRSFGKCIAHRIYDVNQNQGRLMLAGDRLTVSTRRMPNLRGR